MKPYTANHIRALKTIVFFLHENNLSYQITGGFAGNIYGSQWKTSDLDIEVQFKDLQIIESAFSDFIKAKTQVYSDHEFEMTLLRLNVNNVDIDINSVEDFYIINNNKRIKINTDLSNAEKIEFELMTLSVQPLKDILHYKKLLNRIEDVEDLEKLL